MPSDAAAHHRRRWSPAWLTLSVTALLASAAIVFGASALVDEGPASVNVIWQAGTTDAARVALETRFHLRPRERREGTTWLYELRDASVPNIRALVQSPDVVDTHHIDRERFGLVENAPRGSPSPGRLGWYAPTVAFWLRDAGPYWLVGIALVAALFAARPDLASRVRRRTAAWLVRGVPSVSPRTLAAFRLAFGIALVCFLAGAGDSTAPFPRELHRTNAPLANVSFVHALAERPDLVQWIVRMAIGCGVLFTAGVFPRLTFAGAAAGTVLWMFVATLHGGGHPYGVLLLPLLFLAAVPWSEAPTLPWPRAADPDAASRRYGYAPWLLCLSLGTAFAGAAWSKVHDGPTWILNGSVKYAFVADADHALVDWGLTIAAMPRMAVALSAGAVLVEALVICAAFTRSAVARLGAGAAAMSLLIGFYLFQGIMWPAWWLLLLGFLPWQWIDRNRREPEGHQVPSPARWQIACALALIAQQVVVSASGLELEPVASRYDMYSTTSMSPEDFDRNHPYIRRRVVVVSPAGGLKDVTDCVNRFPGWTPDSLQKLDASSSTPRQPLPESCLASLSPSHYRVVEDHRTFDWKSGKFHWKYYSRPVVEIQAPRQ